MAFRTHVARRAAVRLALAAVEPLSVQRPRDERRRPLCDELSSVKK